MSEQRELAAHEADDVTRALRLQVAALEKEAERLRALCSSEMAKNFEYEAEKAAPGRLLAKATRLEAEVARLRLYEAVGATALAWVAADRAYQAHADTRPLLVVSDDETAGHRSWRLRAEDLHTAVTDAHKAATSAAWALAEQTEAAPVAAEGDGDDDDA